VGNHQSVIHENLEFPSVTVDEIMEIQLEEGWTNMYIKWLKNGEEA